MKTPLGRCSVWLFAAFAALLARPAFPQAPPAPDSLIAPAAAEPVSASGPAVLVLANRQIATLRADFLGHPPEKRVESALERITDVIHDKGPGLVSTRNSELGTIVQVDGRLVFTLVPGDVDPFVDQSLAKLADRVRANTQDAIVAYRDQRSVNALVSAILRAILATVIMVRAVQYLRRLIRWLTRKLEAYTARRVERLKMAQATITHQAVALVRLILRVGGLVVALLVVYSWLAYVLDQFPYTSPWGENLGGYLQSTVSTVVWGILHSVPGLLMVVIIFALARLIARWVRLLFESVRHGRLELPGVDADTAVPTQRLVSIFIWVLAVALAFPFIPGSQGPAFKGISVLLGLMVSLGASSVVGQAASGYILMYSRSLRVGDYVRIADHEGTIISLSMLSTKIRTPRDEEINVPNAVVVSSITKNYTRLTGDTGAVLNTTVTIGYSTPWRQVHAMLIEAVGHTKGVRQDAKPVVLQSALSDFYVEYTLLVRLERPETRTVVASALHASIQDVFNEHGVQIMSPHYENDPAGKVWVPRERWKEPPGDTLET